VGTRGIELRRDWFVMTGIIIGAVIIGMSIVGGVICRSCGRRDGRKESRRCCMERIFCNSSEIV
jgi:hypothetical protein